MTQATLDQTAINPIAADPSDRRFGIADEVPIRDPHRLVVRCPVCHEAVPYPGLVQGGAPALAECVRCDLYFNLRPHEVLPADSNGGALCPYTP